MLGPFPHLVFDLQVREYLRHTPSASEIEGLRRFFTELKRHPASNGREVAPRVLHFHISNHIVEIKTPAPGRGLVTRIYRDVTSDIKAFA